MVQTSLKTEKRSQSFSLPTWYLALTGLLGLIVLVGGVLAAMGKLRISPAGSAASQAKNGESSNAGKNGSSSTQEGGRYQIERVEEIQQSMEAAGKLDFFGSSVLQVAVFKYSGGYLQCQVETDVDGKNEVSQAVPDNWNTLLSQDDGIAENVEGAFRKQGYIIFTTMPSQLSVSEALSSYHFQVTGMLSSGPQGPLAVLPWFNMEVVHKRPYRLFVSAGPMPKVTGTGFNDWAEYLLPIKGPFIPKSLAAEEFHVGGGKDLEPGKDIVLLDRRRGNSRVRLKARFLGDGEVREQAKKK
ncbi:MAG: hypothetical protein ACKO23_02715 [Gemmataceae bacterium]